jgi:hypothetical protein
LAEVFKKRMTVSLFCIAVAVLEGGRTARAAFKLFLE